ncbi:CoA ester lyase [Sandaracinobacter sp. RS1-74]|uniref:HpcH/HpaI aldolase/citrate lyase family protein n=1 Tax=Sandaracinobacteroides sayramensis TaxID=2913411 RepID=UPI001EDB140A|nr:CoA ester lyase [Sandaracinobacteroides sayramensis]MCG2841095.1 CoA ester lyase [Sandaracinobacteroides sayramensis]
MTDFRPRRSVLYLPAANARAIEKARGLAADAVILDLEDAVAPEAKDSAREAAVAAIAAGGWGRREMLVRVNSLATAWSEADFAAVAASGADGVVVPKVDGPEDAAKAVALAGGKPVWAMIETPRAVLLAEAVATTPGVAALVAGFADLAKDLRAKPGPDRLPLIFSASRILLAARMAGIPAFDGVYTDIRDPAGLEAEARQGLELGFDGKTCIHPDQIEAVNRIFSPSEAEVEDARGLIAAHEAAAAEGKGVATFKGKLVEVLHVAEARRTLSVSEAIAELRG